MPDIRIAQEVPAVQIITPQEVVYRASVTGKVCRATIVKDNGGDYVHVQGADYQGDVRLIGRDDIISYIAPDFPTSAPATSPVHFPGGLTDIQAQRIAGILTYGYVSTAGAVYSWLRTFDAPPAPQVSAPAAPQTAIEATPRDFVPEAPTPAPAQPLILMPPMDADPRFRYNVERAKLNELYQEWMSERDYHGLVLRAWHTDTPDQRDRLARYEARYRQQLAIVAQAKSKLSSAHLAWYQEEAHRLAASSFFRITADEQLIADVVV